MSDAHEDADCAAVICRVNQFLDHELDEASCDEIRAHLEACEPCMDDFDAVVAVQRLVRRCCADPQAPTELRVSIMAMIRRTDC